MAELSLHGKPVEHAALLDGGYESPEEYADQGDTRTVRDLMFGYTVETTAADGSSQVSATEAMRGDEVSTDQIGLLALRRGEQNHSFYTTAELKALNSGGSAAPSGEANSGNLSEQGEYELVEWLENGDSGSKAPTINEVLDAVGDDKDLAHRMLQAENIRTDGDPRKGLEDGLTAIIQG